MYIAAQDSMRLVINSVPCSGMFFWPQELKANDAPIFVHITDYIIIQRFSVHFKLEICMNYLVTALF